MTRSVEIPEETVEKAHAAWLAKITEHGLPRDAVRAALGAALPYLVPAGDGGLREALEELSEWLRDELKTGVPLTVVDAPEAFELAADRIDATLRSHPAAPAVPQPVDREALSAAVYEKSAAVVLEGGYITTLIAPEDAVAAVLAVLAGEQEQARG